MSHYKDAYEADREERKQVAIGKITEVGKYMVSRLEGLEIEARRLEYLISKEQYQHLLQRITELRLLAKEYAVERPTPRVSF